MGERQDAGHVVIVLTLLLLAEVTDEVAAFRISSSHAVEQERVDIVVEGFVIEKEFGEEAEIAAPSPLPPAVNLKEGDAIITINFITGWVK